MATATDAKTALARRSQGGTVRQLIESMEGEFARALPSHIPARSFLRTALSVLSANPALAECSQRSLLAALMECARLGLEPGTELASLVPFKKQVQLIVQYQGYIELMYRSGMVEAVVTGLIHPGDRWSYNPAKRPPDDFSHEPDLLAADRQDPVLAYAFAWLRGGARSQVVMLNRAQAEKIRDEESKGSKRDDSAWVTHFDSMWIKSCVRRLRKFVPTSTEVRELLERAERVEREPIHVVADVEPAMEPENGSAEDWPEPAKPPEDGDAQA